MKPLTDQERNTFLQAVRDGQDRGTAARLIGRTGTQLKRLSNPDNASYYDAELHTGYLKAISERDQIDYKHRIRPPSHAPTPTVTVNGWTKAKFIPEEDLNTFLEQVAAGTPATVAARMINTTMMQINRRANTDQDFAAQLGEANKEGYPHYQDWLRAKAVDFIEDGNYPALRDQVLIHLPEADKLRTSKHEIGGPGGKPIELIQAVLSQHVPTELLDQLIEQVKDSEAQKQIEAGDP